MVSQKRLFLEVLSQGKKNIALIYNFFWSILTLLGDEIPSIRNVVSKSVVKMYNTYLKCTENGKKCTTFQKCSVILISF